MGDVTSWKRQKRINESPLASKKFKVKTNPDFHTLKTIDDDELSFRPVSLKDLGPVHRLFSEDPDIFRHWESGKAKSRQEIWERVHEWQERAQQGRPSWRAILHEGSFIGLFATTVFGDRLEISYCLKKSAWGQGFCRRAFNTCVAHELTHLSNIEEIYAHFHPNNDNSKRFLEKLGFKNSGKQIYHDEYEDNGDRIEFIRSAQDFRERSETK
ncbi:MAG: GNAT family N-acetyltransferase [bacterium]|nr:GNAT family N-acetyltransferase [bacterium]